jgi:hypothetical protein
MCDLPHVSQSDALQRKVSRRCDKLHLRPRSQTSDGPYALVDFTSLSDTVCRQEVPRLTPGMLTMRVNVRGRISCGCLVGEKQGVNLVRATNPARRADNYHLDSFRS